MTVDRSYLKSIRARLDKALPPVGSEVKGEVVAVYLTTEEVITLMDMLDDEIG